MGSRTARPDLRMPLARRLLRILASIIATAALAQAASASPIAPPGDLRPLLGYDAPRHDTPTLTNATGLIVTVNPDSVSCITKANFEDVVGGEAPGMSYDVPLWSGGVLFGERFLGQSIGYSGLYDVITGTPSNPLQIQAGAVGQNLSVFAYVTNVLTGLGNLGWPDIDAIGEGSIAIALPVNQSRIALDLVGGNGGDAVLSFYRADGTLIDALTVSGLGEFRYGFATGDLSNSIAGILITTTDPSGIGIDNVCHEGTVVPARALSWGTLKTRYR